MQMRGSGCPELVHEARGGVAKRQRHARRENAKQIEQGGKPPCLGAHWSRQANEHGDNLGAAIDFTKVQHVVVLSVIPRLTLRVPQVRNCAPRAAAGRCPTTSCMPQYRGNVA
jgi:hypothetical protein